MIFHPSENWRFVKKTNDCSFSWSGEFIGEVSELLNEIPAIKGNKLYYLSPANQYVILQRYDTKTHIIELIKRIYGLPMIPYNLCHFKNKQYIMYSYTPFNEIEYTLWKRKKDEITDSERLLFFFHWMLGVNGKIVRAYIDGHSGGSVTMSNGKYSPIDYKNTDMTQAKINKYFGTYRNFQNTSIFFNRLEKIDTIRSLMTYENYWWFQEIEFRIRGQVISQPSIPYPPTPQRDIPIIGIDNFQLNSNNQSHNTTDFSQAIQYSSTVSENIPPYGYLSESDEISSKSHYTLFQHPIMY